MCLFPRCRIVRHARLFLFACSFAVVTLFLLNFLNSRHVATNPGQWQLNLADYEPSSALSASASACPNIPQVHADFLTENEFQKLDFQPAWMSRREFFDHKFEIRYMDLRKNFTQSPRPLKIFVMPHSHTDPGWLFTFEEYATNYVNQILDNLVEQLPLLPNMTFIWTEVVFLARWYQWANPHKRTILRNLIQNGRLELTSGTWVMTDEASPHLYSMLDQMIEGHQWVWSRFKVKPKSAWSVDPFGHGATAPYLLKKSGLENTIIQRIHYAWKPRLGWARAGDFRWRQRFDPTGSDDILTHHLPYEVYPIRHTCGPHTMVCDEFDFQKIPGEYNTDRARTVPIDDFNVQVKAELLLEQYRKTSTLYPADNHALLVPLGDDFRYSHAVEWTQQYQNYQKMFDYINAHPDRYQTQMQFGTLSQYFDEIKAHGSLDRFPVLSGDFFPYADVFNEGRPAYWTGYFSTRPLYKQLAREVESALRATEIIYSLTTAQVRQRKSVAERWRRVLDHNYEQLVTARRDLGLFMHHDAITGTSKAHVMRNYGQRLFTSLQNVEKLQSRCASLLLSSFTNSSLLFADSERSKYEDTPSKLYLSLERNFGQDKVSNSGDSEQSLVLYNQDPHWRTEVVKTRVSAPFLQVLDAQSHPVTFQVNPIWFLDRSSSESTSFLQYSEDQFELVFVAHLAPLSISTFLIRTLLVTPSVRNVSLTNVYCPLCSDTGGKLPFNTAKLPVEDIMLQNSAVKLLVDGKSGLLKSWQRRGGQKTRCHLQFGAYTTAPYHSGAYLFMTDTGRPEPDWQAFKDQLTQIYITSGPVASEVSVLVGHTLVHSTIIYHDPALQEGVYMENRLDLSNMPHFRGNDVIIRFQTDLDNKGVVFTDQNGFQMQKRVTIKSLGVEGNYYPVTDMVYLQDGTRRLSLLVGRAHGCTGFYDGALECVLDRKTMYDDARGMGEGVMDSKATTTKFWLLLEPNGNIESNQPSLLAVQRAWQLSYPSSQWVVTRPNLKLTPFLTLVNQAWPCEVQLLVLRTLSEETEEAELPSKNALMVVHRRGYDCSVPFSAEKSLCFTRGEKKNALPRGTEFLGVSVSEIRMTLLTGLGDGEENLVTGFGDLPMKPMELRALRVTFK